MEDWDYPAEKVHELDWNESLAIDIETALRCLPSRHFSGRLLLRNRTLWASFLIDGPRKIFVSGDGGYGSHFARIGQEFPGIDLAIMENGQYNEHWKYIHTMPDLLTKAIDELSPRRVMTYHHSKFALSRHPWTEPLDNIVTHATGKSWKLVQPRIGEVLYLDQDQEFEKWW
jgi:L-ascorbate metabolism protein UlaG (beta-lactamase superfamily)